MSVKTKAEWEKLSSNLNFNNEAFINGKFVKAQSEKTFDCFNPSNGKLLTKVSSCDETDVDSAVKSCRKHLIMVTGQECHPLKEKRYF